jgi:exopolyphosphatase / guanosine-5'-triphosphate,3'-diphosphate pyrophosphatase
MWRLHHKTVPVGVIDVGSNTVRLLVARDGEALGERRAVLGLGAAIERDGGIPDLKLAETADCVAEFVKIARREHVDRLEVLVTSPGRQARNGDELLDRLAAAAQVPVRLLSAEEEGRLAFVGAISNARGLEDKDDVAVCDVGGGSAQVTIGTISKGVAWTQSIDIGSRRLASRCFSDDPPGRAAIREARAQVEQYLDAFTPPAAKVALAVGGSARSLRSLVGTILGPDELERALALLAKTPADEISLTYDLDPGRLSTLAAGAVILAALQERLDIQLRVGRGGLREGAVLELAARREAA